MNAAPDMAQAGGISAEAGLAGLVRMWAWCFRKQVDQVETAQVGGWFGGEPARVSAALVAFGFLAPREAGWRVRGAHRYIRLAEARRRGGLAARSNLVPGARHRVNSLGSSRETAEKQPEVSLGSGSALTPSTEHRAPKTEKKKLAGSAPADPRDGGDSTYQALVAALFVLFREHKDGHDYDPSGKDWTALADLRKRHDGSEIIRRWAIGLQARYGARCATFWALRERWNDCVVPEATSGPQNRAPNGAATAADKDWT